MGGSLGPGHRLAAGVVDVVGGTGRHLPLLDSRNAVAAYWSDQAGQLSSTAAYNAEGRVTLRAADGSISCAEVVSGTTCSLPAGGPFGFSVAWRSSVTGLVSMRARWYSPQLGEFLSQDEAGYVDSFNLYGYVGFDPINRWDWDGRKGDWVTANADPRYPNLAPAVEIANTWIPALAKPVTVEIEMEFAAVVTDAGHAAFVTTSESFTLALGAHQAGPVLVIPTSLPGEHTGETPPLSTGEVHVDKFERPLLEIARTIVHEWGHTQTNVVIRMTKNPEASYLEMSGQRKSVRFKHPETGTWTPVVGEQQTVGEAISQFMAARFDSLILRSPSLLAAKPQSAPVPKMKSAFPLFDAADRSTPSSKSLAGRR